MYPYVRWRQETLSDFCFNYWIFVKHIFVSSKPWIELTDRNLLYSPVTQWRHRAHGHHLPFRKELESSHFISKWSTAALCAFWAIPTIVFTVPLHRGFLREPSTNILCTYHEHHQFFLATYRCGCPWEPDEGVRSPDTAVRRGCESTCIPNSCVLQE